MTKTQSPWYERVVKEKNKLDKKIDALADFMDNEDNHGSVDPEQMKLMKIQLPSMIVYSNILNMRIEAEDNWTEDVEDIIEGPKVDPDDRKPSSKMNIIEINSPEDLNKALADIAQSIMKDMKNDRNKK